MRINYQAKNRREFFDKIADAMHLTMRRRKLFVTLFDKYGLQGSFRSTLVSLTDNNDWDMNYHSVQKCFKYFKDLGFITQDSTDHNLYILNPELLINSGTAIIELCVTLREPEYKSEKIIVHTVVEKKEEELRVPCTIEIEGYVNPRYANVIKKDLQDTIE